MANVHVYPCRQEWLHNLEGLACSCRPRYEVPCSQCEGRGQSDPPCWKCAGEGFTTGTPEEAQIIGDGIVVVHNLFEFAGEEIDPFDF